MLSKFFKYCDVFGYHVELTISASRSRAQTSVLGGIVTILMYCFIFTFFAIKIQKMSAGSLDNITEMEELTDFKALQKVHLQGMMPYVTYVADDVAPFEYIGVDLI